MEYHKYLLYLLNNNKIIVKNNTNYNKILNYYIDNYVFVLSIDIKKSKISIKLTKINNQTGVTEHSNTIYRDKFPNKNIKEYLFYRYFIFMIPYYEKKMIKLRRKEREKEEKIDIKNNQKKIESCLMDSIDIKYKRLEKLKKIKK